jgi:hypothetical protein
LRITGRLFLGLAIIALGVLFTLDNLGLAHAGAVLRWWPLLLLVYGLVRLSGFCCRRNLVVGGLFTLVGAWLLLHALGLVEQSLWDLWPVFLIALGVSMVLRAMSRQRGVGPGEDTSSSLNAFAFWSGIERKVVTQDFRGGDVTAVMGGHDLDLRPARIASGPAVIDLFVWWGGVDIRVPQDWKVSCEALPIMAGIEDQTRPPAGEAKGHLILKGLVVMGGVEVKN